MITLKEGFTALEVDSQGLRLVNVDRNELLIDSAGGWPLLPIIDGKPVSVSFGECRETKDGVEVVLQPDEDGPLAAFSLYAKAVGNAFELCCELTLRSPGQLTALSILPSQSSLNLYEIINFRNRHFTARTWPELLIGQEAVTTTYSNDWQFAPHPTALLFQKEGTSVFAGFSALQASFGFHIEVKHFHVERWEVDFGANPHGLPLGAGETFRSAPLRIFTREGRSPHEMFAEFGAHLISEGAIPDPAVKVRHTWWREPLYCTWGDQWMISETVVAESLADQTAESASPAASLLTEDLVWRAVDVIRREKFPIRTIILDEGWAVARGDWRPDPSRLPDFRGMVDRLHAEGFRVMVWWNWAEIAAHADVGTEFLVGGGWTNKHGGRWRDYSDPKVQDGYLKPLFRTFFSSESGCYDLDGVKTDFLADKVHAETPVCDPAWRGEERYFLKVTELFYREMRKHKPDACHLGCAGNYWLADLIDLNRTYDVHSSNWRDHEERGLMLACTTPGAPVSYDMMTCTENTDRWFDSAARLGASVEIGNVLQVRDSCLTGTRSADAAYLAMVGKGLSRNCFAQPPSGQ